MNFGSKLKNARIKKGITQENLAEKLGVSHQTISKWESGSYPETLNLILIANVLEVSLDELFSEELYYQKGSEKGVTKSQIGEVYDMLYSENSKGELIKTGFKKLDSVIGGFERKKLYYLGGAGSMGKTVVMLNFVGNILLQKKAVTYFSFCTDKKVILKKLIQTKMKYEQSVPYKKISEVKEEEKLDFINAAQVFQNVELNIIDKPNISIDQIKEILQTTRQDLVVIDDANMLCDGIENDHAYSKTISTLKQIAIDTDCPIVVLERISGNYGVEREESEDLEYVDLIPTGAKPSMDDMKCCYYDKRTFDGIFFIHREEYFSLETPYKGIMEFRIYKAGTFLDKEECIQFYYKYQLAKIEEI